MFGYVEKQLSDKKAKVNFKFFDLADWTAINCNTHITQYLKKKRQTSNKIWSVSKI